MVWSGVDSAPQSETMRKTTILLLALLLPLVIALVARMAVSRDADGVTIYVVPAITDDKILPTTSISREYASSQISVVAAPGEFEPASFVVRANQDIRGLAAAATDLDGDNASIPSSCIDIKLVKCWWQAKPAETWPWIRDGAPVTGPGSDRVLVPELLVNDPGFIITDDRQHNYIKQIDGSYRCISEDLIMKERENPLASEMSVRDSPTLLPVDVSAKTNQQFWVTIEVPTESAPGLYLGTINLSTPSGLSEVISVELEVLPFGLQPSTLEHAVFASMTLVDDSEATIGLAKSEQQVKAELRDMYEHGVTVPYVTESDEDSLRHVLQWMRETGFTGNTLYYHGLHSLMDVTDSDPGRLQTLKSEVQRVVDVAAGYGFSDVLIYGVDEATANDRLLEIPNYQTVHDAGAKVFIGSHTGTYETVGNVVDLVVWPGEPDPIEAAKWHSIGHEILCYSNPQSGVEAPGTYRRNFGLLLWQKDYDGGGSFAYQWVEAGNIWSDFSGSQYRSEVFAYPTMDGVVDTIGWEGWREGADDMRYLSTLLKTIADAQAANKDTSEAEDWLDDLKVSNLATRELDAIRSEMIGHILSLS